MNKANVRAVPYWLILSKYKINKKSKINNKEIITEKNIYILFKKEKNYIKKPTQCIKSNVSISL